MKASRRTMDEAIEWLVINDSGKKQGKGSEARWEFWRRNRFNRNEYLGILEMMEDAREFAPPPLVSGAALRADAEADERIVRLP